MASNTIQEKILKSFYTFIKSNQTLYFEDDVPPFYKKNIKEYINNTLNNCDKQLKVDICIHLMAKYPIIWNSINTKNSLLDFLTNESTTTENPIYYTLATEIKNLIYRPEADINNLMPLLDNIYHKQYLGNILFEKVPRHALKMEETENNEKNSLLDEMFDVSWDFNKAFMSSFMNQLSQHSSQIHSDKPKKNSGNSVYLTNWITSNKIVLSNIQKENIYEFFEICYLDKGWPQQDLHYIKNLINDQKLLNNWLLNNIANQKFSSLFKQQYTNNKTPLLFDEEIIKTYSKQEIQTVKNSINNSVVNNYAGSSSLWVKPTEIFKYLQHSLDLHDKKFKPQIDALFNPILADEIKKETTTVLKKNLYPTLLNKAKESIIKSTENPSNGEPPIINDDACALINFMLSKKLITLLDVLYIFDTNPKNTINEPQFTSREYDEYLNRQFIYDDLPLIDIQKPITLEKHTNNLLLDLHLMPTINTNQSYWYRYYTTVNTIKPFITDDTSLPSDIKKTISQNLDIWQLVKNISPSTKIDNQNLNENIDLIHQHQDIIFNHQQPLQKKNDLRETIDLPSCITKVIGLIIEYNNKQTNTSTAMIEGLINGLSITNINRLIDLNIIEKLYDGYKEEIVSTIENIILTKATTNQNHPIIKQDKLKL